MDSVSVNRHPVGLCVVPLLMATAWGVTINAAVAGDETQAGHHHQLQHNTQAATVDPEAHHVHYQHLAEQIGYKKTQEYYVLPALKLISMQGESVSLTKVLDTDKPIAINFIFTSCTTICPIMSATFSHAQKKLGSEAEQVRWVSISIDPEYDTPERLRDYAQRFGAGSEWQFFTGSIDNVVAIQKAFDAYRGDKMNHIPATFLRAGRDAPWVRLNGLTSGSQLVDEYRQMMANR